MAGFFCSDPVEQLRKVTPGHLLAVISVAATSDSVEDQWHGTEFQNQFGISWGVRCVRRPNPRHQAWAKCGGGLSNTWCIRFGRDGGSDIPTLWPADLCDPCRYAHRRVRLCVGLAAVEIRRRESCRCCPWRRATSSISRISDGREESKHHRRTCDSCYRCTTPAEWVNRWQIGS